MPTSNPKSTKEKRLEATRKRWEEAERGTGNLRKVRFFDFEDLPAEVKKEFLTEPTILTAEGVETCVVMTVEQFFSLIPAERVHWGKWMCRQDGILFRQVV